MTVIVAWFNIKVSTWLTHVNASILESIRLNGLLKTKSRLSVIFRL